MFFISLLTFTKSPALLPIFKACSDLPGHGDITAHSQTGLEKLSWSFSEVERDSSLELPWGSEFQAAVGPCPAASSVWRGPEGQRQGSLWQWIICLSVTVPAGRDAQDCVGVCVCQCVCACEIDLCRVLLQAHLCFSRFNIHLLRVNTKPVFSWNADTSNVSVPL